MSNKEHLRLDVLPTMDPGRLREAPLHRAAPQACARLRPCSANWVAGVVTCAILAFGCTDSSSKTQETSIRIGSSLPFTGKESAMGRNLEQAMILAVEDVNNAGGIAGTPLELISRDSNSGSERGFTDLLDLLYNEKVAYLIGPEENELASRIVEDIRGLDVLNVLSGYAAPSSNSSSTTGAWLRLAPTPYAIACGLGAHAIAEGAQTANALYSLEDYNTSLATDFRFHFRNMGGKLESFVTVQPDQSSYADAIQGVAASSADQTLLIAYPAAAAELVTEWTVAGRQGSFYLSPLLRTEVFLLNIPYGALDGSFGLSPTLSLVSECETMQGYTSGQIQCTSDNSRRFVSHFSERWDGTSPFDAAHFYYDAVLLLATAMQYAMATQGAIPATKQLHELVRALSQSSNAPGYWYDLASTMANLGAGRVMKYVGAAAEYEFDSFGVAQHRTFDSWIIRQNEFVDQGAYYASCIDISAT
jgi:ABC-type branched-subunit amino acid transport system substrate-binding protein